MLLFREPPINFTDLSVILSNKVICITIQREGGKVCCAHFSEMPDEICDQSLENFELNNYYKREVSH